MPTFEHRYLNGQCVEVWNDLIALGDRVRDKSILADAQAVADETMRRARQNLEMLIPRLAAVGYRFAAPALERQLARIEKTLANPQLAPYVRRQLERAVRGGRADASVLNPAENKAVQLGLETKRREKAVLLAELERMRTMPPLENPRVFYPPEDQAAYAEDKTETFLKQLEKDAKGPIPLSLQAWYHHVGHVSLNGSHPVLNPDGNAIPDPLVVNSVAEISRSSVIGRQGDKIVLPVSLIDVRKAGLSTVGLNLPSEYRITIPNPSADWLVENEWRATYFVNYLRKAFEWAGFPGWERDPNPPVEMISKLTEGFADDMINIAIQGRIILEHPASFFGTAEDGRIVVLSRQGEGTFLSPGLSILSRFSIANQPSGVALSMDGLELAVTAADGISFYSTSTFEKTGYLNDAFLSCLYGSPDLFWTCSRFSTQTAVLEVWNRGSKTRIAKLKVGDPYGDSHFWVWPHPLAGSVVVWAAAGQDGQSLFWATLEGDAIRLVRFRDLDYCTPPGFCPDGKEFLVSGEGELLRYAYPDGPLLGKMNELPEDETIGDHVSYLDDRRALLTSIMGRMFVVQVHEMEVVDEAALDGPDLTFFLPMPEARFLSVHRNWSGDHDQLMVWTAASVLDGC